MLSERLSNLFLNRNVSMVPQVYGEAFSMIFASTMVIGDTGFEISSRAVIPYIAWRAWNIKYKNHSQIGEHVSFQRTVALKNIQLPQGNEIKIGEVFGRITLINNLWRMSKLGSPEKQIKIALDATRFMSRLVQKIEDQDEDVRDLKGFKAKAHLVAQNPHVFERFGFTVLPKKETALDDFKLKTNQVLSGVAFGGGGFLTTGDFNFIKDAYGAVKKIDQTAWATPESLVANKKEILKEYQRVHRRAQRSGVTPSY